MEMKRERNNKMKLTVTDERCSNKELVFEQAADQLATSHTDCVLHLTATSQPADLEKTLKSSLAQRNVRKIRVSSLIWLPQQ